MDFSAILDTIYSQEQALSLIRALGICLSLQYMTDGHKKKMQEIFSHEQYEILAPLLEKGNGAQEVEDLKKKIEKLPIMTIFTPFVVSEKTVAELGLYVRRNISEFALISLVRKNIRTPLAIEWNGTYGEF